MYVTGHLGGTSSFLSTLGYFGSSWVLQRLIPRYRLREYFFIGHPQIVSARVFPVLLYVADNVDAVDRTWGLFVFFSGECLIQPYRMYHRIGCESLRELCAPVRGRRNELHDVYRWWVIRDAVALMPDPTIGQIFRMWVSTSKINHLLSLMLQLNFVSNHRKWVCLC